MTGPEYEARRDELAGAVCDATEIHTYICSMDGPDVETVRPAPGWLARLTGPEPEPEPEIGK